MWYLKGELDARRKFINMREAMLVFSQNEGSSGAGFNNDGTGESDGTAVPGLLKVSSTLSKIEARLVLAILWCLIQWTLLAASTQVIVAIDKQGSSCLRTLST